MSKAGSSVLAFVFHAVLLLHGGDLAADDSRAVLTLEYENDAFVHDDRWYSCGLKVNWLSSGDAPPDWLLAVAKTVPFFDASSEIPWGWSLEQRIYSPDDIVNPDLPPEDRPYAGWLNLSFSVASKSENRLTRVHAGFGIVGPASMAEQSQKLIHKLTGSNQPKGWDSQLPHEPVLLLAYDRQHRFGRSDTEFELASDWVASAGGTLSNAITQAQTGISWRFGRQLTDEFMPPRISSVPAGPPYLRITNAGGWYFFLGAGARYVAHNIFLDGTTFRSSPSVERIPWVGEAYAGYVYYRQGFRISYMLVAETEEFVGQGERQRFGAFAMSWMY